MRKSLTVEGALPKSEQARFLNPLVLSSINAAIARGQSLALIRPKNTLFTYRRKTSAEIQAERDAFKKAAAQMSIFDHELAALEPTPFEFRFKFGDDTRHDFENGDWEARALFWNGGKRGMPEQEILDWMDHVQRRVPRKGMLFAVSNQAKRPHVWQMLGVLRVDNPAQGTLPL